MSRTWVRAVGPTRSNLVPPLLPVRSRIRHYTGLSAMVGKLKKLLADFEWTRADTLLPAQQERAQPWRAAA